jgi:hypothetical protein
MDIWVCNIDRMVWGKLMCLERNLSQCRFLHHKSYLDWPGIEHGPLCWEAGDSLHKPWHCGEPLRIIMIMCWRYILCLCPCIIQILFEWNHPDLNHEVILDCILHARLPAPWSNSADHCKTFFLGDSLKKEEKLYPVFKRKICPSASSVMKETRGLLSRVPLQSILSEDHVSVTQLNRVRFQHNTCIVHYPLFLFSWIQA